MNRLAALLDSLKGLFTFWIIINQYERGLLFRLGKVKRELGPGFYWLIPLVDEVVTENIVLTTIDLNFQSLTTKDASSIVVSAIIAYKIVNLTKFLITVEDADSVLIDSTHGIVSEYVRDNNWDTICKLRFQQEIFEEIQRKAINWGIKVHNFTFSNLVKSKAIRLFQEVSND